MSASFATLLARLLAAPLADAVADILKSVQQRRLSEAQARVEIERAITAAMERIAAAELAARRDILLAELRGESWLQRHWRPLVALTAFFSYWYVIIIIPHLVSWNLLTPPGFGERGIDNLFWLATVMAGGYMGGRTLEKVVRIWRSSSIP